MEQAGPYLANQHFKMEASAFMDEVKHYEDIRNSNLADNKIMLDKLMSDFQKYSKKPTPVKKTKKASQKMSAAVEGDDFIRRNPSRHARSTPSRFDLPYTRSRRRSGSVSSSISSASSASPSSTPEKMVVRFGFFKRIPSSSNSNHNDDFIDDLSDEEAQLPRENLRQKTVTDTRSVDEITEADLDRVAFKVSIKNYNKEYGSSCHQCRQKTDDQKTICRGTSCFGVRGQFCGVCLNNRYGEDAKAALLDPEWECPPCRGICNCSFCRKKGNKAATGILIHLARHHGYSDVNSYLTALRNKTN